MALSWGVRRQFLYYAVATVTFLILAVAVQQLFFSKAPTCSDGRQNGGELGVDCGGPCTLLCEHMAQTPGLIWARAFPSSPQRYTAAAYIQNHTPNAGAKSAQYFFRLYDASGLLVREVEGVIDLPPIPTIPIIETNIDVGNRTVASTQFAFTFIPEWRRVEVGMPILRVSNLSVAESGARVEADIRNDSFEDAKNVAVVVVLFDIGGVARAASKSFIATLGSKSSERVIFTWPAPNPNVARAEITVLPSF